MHHDSSCAMSFKIVASFLRKICIYSWLDLFLCVSLPPLCEVEREWRKCNTKTRTTVTSNCVAHPDNTWGLLYQQRLATPAFGLGHGEITHGSYSFPQLKFNDFSRTFSGQIHTFQALSKVSERLVFRNLMWADEWQNPCKGQLKCGLGSN